jgi:hypothetical protein
MLSWFFGKSFEKQVEEFEEKINKITPESTEYNMIHHPIFKKVNNEIGKGYGTLQTKKRIARTDCILGEIPRSELVR